MEKMTIEALEAKARELENNVGHLCEVVPFNSIEWEKGVIKGVTIDKRSLKVFYQIKLESGAKLVKAVDAKFLKILEEVVELPAKAAKVEWGEDGADQAIDEVGHNIGRLVTFTKPKEEDPIEGRIIGVIADKRVSSLLYKIKVGDKIVYKVTSALDLKIAEEFDEEGQGINDAFLTRRGRAAVRKNMTPEEKLQALESDYAKAEEALKKAMAKLEAAKAELEAAKAELNKEA